MKDNLCTLRSIVKADAPLLVKWFNDKQLSKYMDDSEDDKVYDVSDIYSMVESIDQVYLAFQHNNQLTGYASLYNIVNTEAEFSFLIGIKSMHNKGLGTQLLNLLSIKAFSSGIKTLYCWIYKNNFASIRCATKAGFIIDDTQISLNNEIKLSKILSKN